jgi:multiple sugar transport system substrate-binding protein
MSDTRTPGAGGASPVGRPVGRSRRQLLRLVVLGGGALSLTPLLNACGGGGASAPAAAPAAPGAPAAAPAAPAAAKPAQAGPGGFSGGGTLKILGRADFVPAFDTWLDKFAEDWGAKNKVEVQFDHVFPGEVPAKIAAEVAAAGGHDLYNFSQTGAVPLYAKQLVDLSDIAKQVGDKYGGWISPLSERYGQVEGVWRGVPDNFIDFPTLYRKDLFDANGLKPPDTWDDLLKAGTILKGKGNPIGICINQKANDGNNSWNTLLWCYGASYVGEDGKTVTINSPQTKEAVAYALELYRKTMTDVVLSWDDSGNNQYLASGVGSWIQNPISALRTIEDSNKELAAKIGVGNALAGPKGRLAACTGSTWGLMSYSKSQPAAKAFLVDYYGVYLDGIKASTGFHQPMLKDFRKKPMAILGDDPRLAHLQDFDQIARASGHPGPPSTAASEVESNWIIPLMMAQAVQSGSVDQAVDWATGKVEAIYAKYK